MTKEELMKRLEESAVAIFIDEGSYDYMFRAIADEVKASDLVEVIRCKDCKYCHYSMPRKWAKRDEKGNLIGFEDVQDPPYCDWWIDDGYGFDVEENDFCSHAERKEER
jgi:hypothetical protein